MEHATFISAFNDSVSVSFFCKIKHDFLYPWKYCAAAYFPDHACRDGDRVRMAACRLIVEVFRLQSACAVSIVYAWVILSMLVGCPSSLLAVCCSGCKIRVKLLLFPILGIVPEGLLYEKKNSCYSLVGNW